jgi:SAM-dependent methyltransferase
MEPVEAMLHWASAATPGCAFLAARAEAIPIRDGAIDLIAAAGSLNYIDPALFFREAERILAPGGIILVYDFSPGRSFPESDALDAWFARFIDRYPWPPSDALKVDPERLATMDHRFRLQNHERFEIPLTLTPDFYLEYMMTETNVSFALRNGEAEDAIRSWCASTLDPIWPRQPKVVLFRGYFACLARTQ